MKLTEGLEVVPNEYLVERMRIRRDYLLKDSDLKMISDVPTDKTAWATYRQALRDFPATWQPSEIANFPEPPT